MDQFDMFSMETPYAGAEGYVCIKCGVRQPTKHFPVLPSGEVKRTCASCSKSQQRVRKQLEKENPYPNTEDYSCPICLRTVEEMDKYDQKRMKKFFLDHCHDTNEFRGWICHHCNVGLGGFSDDIVKLKRAVAYLEEANERIRLRKDKE